MRLINAKALTLTCFNNQSTIPNYAILSHTWGEDEISMRDLLESPHEQLIDKASFQKVRNCCLKTIEWDLEWLWMDTLCIDQTSSAELSEAINSMYDWYRQSSVCFAYLSDISTVENDLLPNAAFGDEKFLNFQKARWFTRGWCLQELLAPRNMQFYNREWEYIGSKYSLKKHISDITSIDEDGMFIPDLSVLSVAHRMSWAARRETTRPEDLAYCLLGIFNINMPLIYGEGQVRAFIRLQEEIMQRTEDHSIFAWNGQSLDFANDMVGLLAPHPSAFTYGKVELCQLPEHVGPLAVTGRGIKAHLPTVPYKDGFLAVIGCRPSGSADRYYGVPIKFILGTSNVYHRSLPHLQPISLADYSQARTGTKFLLRNSKPTHLEAKDITQVWLKMLEMRECIFTIGGAYPNRNWNTGRRTFAFLESHTEYPHMALLLTGPETSQVVLEIALDLRKHVSTVELRDVTHSDLFNDMSRQGVRRDLRCLLDRSVRLHSQTRHRLRIGRYVVVATIERIVVFGQELYEVKISIGPMQHQSPLHNDSAISQKLRPWPAQNLSQSHITCEERTG